MIYSGPDPDPAKKFRIRPDPDPQHCKNGRQHQAK
jgi:hypothetical protein